MKLHSVGGSIHTVQELRHYEGLVWTSAFTRTLAAGMINYKMFGADLFCAGHLLLLLRGNNISKLGFVMLADIKPRETHIFFRII